MRRWPRPVTGDYMDAMERVIARLHQLGRIERGPMMYWDGQRLHRGVLRSQHLSRSGVRYRQYIRLRQRNHGIW